MALSAIHSISATLNHILNVAFGDEEEDSASCTVPAACIAAPEAGADEPQQSEAPSVHTCPAAAAVSGTPPPLLTILSTKAELLNRTLTHVEVVARARPSADSVFNLVAEPSNHTEIFDPIQSTTYETVSDDGNTVVYNLDYMTKWNFWKFSGVAESKLVMTVVRQQRTVTFALREPGFLLKYEGGWSFTVDADDCSGITIGFAMQPKLQPPYPLNLILKKQQLQQVEGMLHSLAEAADKQPAAALAATEQAADAGAASEELEPGWVAVSAPELD